MSFLPSRKPMLSPCIGICELDVSRMCKGCRRTSEEIAHWIEYSDAERARLMYEVLPQRAKVVLPT